MVSGATRESQRFDPAKLASHYKHLLMGKSAAAGAQGPEALERKLVQPDLSDNAIDERIESAREQLYRVVKEYLGDKPELYELADKVAARGKVGLHAVVEEDESKLGDADILAALEVIVRNDGSRPSFMVRYGEPDTATSPLGEWGGVLADSAERLRRSIRCIGRVDDPSGRQGFQGTGVLIGDNTVMTNRHVLQAIAAEGDDGSWQLKPNIAVDFGREFRATESARRRSVRGVIFAGAKRIGASIDHSKLDVAMLELEPGAEETDEVLPVDIAPDWGQPETGVFICGYPGNPGPFGPDAPSVLELLFQSTFGFKRLAPGLVTTAANELPGSPRQWSLGHDATTLGGNSGSAVLIIGRETTFAGLHFGGRNGEPRENWCHVLGLVLGEPDARSGKTLREVLNERGARLSDRIDGTV